jgi:hypothetical protein
LYGTIYLSGKSLYHVVGGEMMQMRLEAALPILPDLERKEGTTNAGNYYKSDPDYRNTNFGHLGVF